MRAHLENLERQMRAPHPELAPVECPALLAHVWLWFTELAGARASGMGPSPIAYAEIAAWARLTQRAPAPFEVGCLRQLDDVFLRASVADAKPQGKRA